MSSSLSTAVGVTFFARDASYLAAYSLRALASLSSLVLYTLLSPSWFT